MAALEERSSRERAFVYPEALYPDDFDPTTYEVALGTTYLNAIIDVYPRVNTVTHTITLPPASADLAGSKIGFSGPSNALILVKSLVNVDPNRVILVSLQGRGEFVVLNNGNGDYNWHTRSLDQPGLGGGSPGGTARDLGAVPAQKALDVVTAYQDNGGPFVETDTLYYGQYFIDDFTSPGNVFKYSCDIWRPATTGNPTVYKWGRYLEAGM